VVDIPCAFVALKSAAALGGGGGCARTRMQNRLTKKHYRYLTESEKKNGKYPLPGKMRTH
jgi:hypothetical protein